MNKNSKTTHNEKLSKSTLFGNSSAIHEEKIEHNRWVKVHELLVTFKLFGCNARSGIKETLTT